jgi:hypothetical protein
MKRNSYSKNICYINGYILYITNNIIICGCHRYAFYYVKIFSPTFSIDDNCGRNAGIAVASENEQNILLISKYKEKCKIYNLFTFCHPIYLPDLNALVQSALSLLHYILYMYVIK